MDLSTVKTENGNVSCETPEGTVVHININQRSALDCLLDTFRYCRDMRKGGQKTEPPRTGSSAHLGFGVAYMSLGLVSVMLAIILCVVETYLVIRDAGVHFWVGFPFLVSGALNLVAYKYPLKCWAALAFISLLVNFSVSIAGMVLTVGDLQRLHWMGPDLRVCDNLRNGRRGGYDYNRGTDPPRYGWENDYDLEQCRDGIQRYKDFTLCFTVMTLLVMIWGLCLVILHMGLKLKSCWSSCKLERTEEDDALMKPDPSDDIIIA